jgi:hypothetical protein
MGMKKKVLAGQIAMWGICWEYQVNTPHKRHQQDQPGYKFYFK